MLRDTGGIKPHERKRAVAHLTLSEREEIRAGLSAKMSIRAIATALNRSPSTISREVQRNRGRRYYKAVDANNRANRMAKRPKPCLLDQNLPLRKLVLEKLEMKWSPEQISGWLRRTKPRQKTLRISPETIYKTLYFRSREALHHLNIQHLRRSHSLRHGRRHTRKGAPEAGFEHQKTMPSAPAPDGLPSETQIAQSLAHLLPPVLKDKFICDRPLEVRPVEFHNPLKGHVAEPHRQVWIRANGSVPDDLRVHQYLLGYASDLNFLFPARRCCAP